MSIEIERDSWVLKVAAYGGLEFEDRTDLCSVFWGFVRGVLKAPVLIGLGAAVGTLALYHLLMLPIIGLIAYFVHGLWFSDGALVAMAAWVFLPWFFYELMAAERGKSAPVVTSVRILRAGYRGWKDKTCVLVDVR